MHEGNAMKHERNKKFIRRTAFALTAAALSLSFAAPTCAAETQLNLGSRFNQYVANAVSDILSEVVTIPKKYSLNDSDLVAPQPNEACYGTAADSEEIRGMLEKASSVLDGQTWMLTPDTQLMDGTAVRYYLDETIFSVAWKQVIDSAVYTFCETKVMDASQFRRFYAGGTFGTTALSTTTEMAKSVNAVSATSGDYYVYRPSGISVNNGVVYRIDRGRAIDTCFIDTEGDLLLVGKGTLITQEEVEQYVKENNIRFSLAFGPILVKDGAQCAPATYEFGQINENYSRAALCQLGKLHYLTVTVNSGPDAYHLPNVKSFAKQLQALGIDNAYALDGGQTATIVLGNELINDVDYGDERKISDIIYFATAIPGEK